jgi:hypothetical protein
MSRTGARQINSKGLHYIAAVYLEIVLGLQDFNTLFDEYNSPSMDESSATSNRIGIQCHSSLVSHLTALIDNSISLQQDHKILTVSCIRLIHLLLVRL